jgi:hypothetical protein
MRYSLRSAVIGSSLAALRAGMTPAATPTTIESPNPITTDHTETTNGNLKARELTKAIRIPPPAPMQPPIIEMATASIKNWVKMAEWVAPNALRIPISRVRSTIETSIMLAMPMPPTRREMLAIATTKMVKTPITLEKVLIKSAWLVTRKSSLSGLSILCLSRKILVT